MNEAVVDASAMIKALTERADDALELADRIRDIDTYAPHLIHAEVGDVLRRKVLLGEIEAETALTALLTVDTMIDDRYPHGGALARDAWELRDRVRFYDALYVVLAARLELPLLTADGKLSGAHGLPCKVEVV